MAYSYTKGSAPGALSVMVALHTGHEGVPVGTIIAWPSNILPDDFAVADGRELNRVTYVDLFNVHGTTWGGGDGSTTFNIPNLLGMVLAGADPRGTPTLGDGLNEVGETGGAAAHTLTAANLAAHDHPIPDHGHTLTDNTLLYSPDRDPTQNEQRSDRTEDSIAIPVLRNPGALNTSRVTGASTDDAGSGVAISLLQPTAIVQWIIRIQ